MLTKGHGINTPGLRGHSVGDTYPYTVIAEGDLHHTLKFRPMCLITGARGFTCDSAEEAAAQIPIFRSCCEFHDRLDASWDAEQRRRAMFDRSTHDWRS